MRMCIICSYVCMYVRMYVCMYICMYACMNVCMCDICMHVCMYLRMYVCMYVCMYACIYICMYTYTYIEKEKGCLLFTDIQLNNVYFTLKQNFRFCFLRSSLVMNFFSYACS